MTFLMLAGTLTNGQDFNKEALIQKVRWAELDRRPILQPLQLLASLFLASLLTSDQLFAKRTKNMHVSRVSRIQGPFGVLTRSSGLFAQYKIKINRIY